MVSQDEIHEMVSSEDVDQRRAAADLLGEVFVHLENKESAWRDLEILIEDDDYDVQYDATQALVLAFPYIPDKSEAWRDLQWLTERIDYEVRRAASEALGLVFIHVSDKLGAWEDIVWRAKLDDHDVQAGSIESLELAFPMMPDKAQAWHDIHELIQDNDKYRIRRVINILGSIFHYIPDKEQAWNDLIKLTEHEENDVRFEAASSLGSAFFHIFNKEKIWNDLHKLTEDDDKEVRRGAALSIGPTFPHVPDKEQAWNDLHRLSEDRDRFVRRGAALSIGPAFLHIPDKEQAWNNLHRLTEDENNEVRQGAAESFGSAFPHIPYKEQAWNDLQRLTKDKDLGVLRTVVGSMGSAFPYLPDKDQAWQDLHKLAQDEKRAVQMYAYHSLGRASVFKATEAYDNDALKKELEAAITYFEKSIQEARYGPARFCYPFYRSYLAVAFQEAKEDEVQKYLADAKEAVDGSESKVELLEAVEILAKTLQESRRLKDRPFHEVVNELKTYRWYCDEAEEHMAAAEGKAPRAVKLMRKSNPLIKERIESTIKEIQDIARQICQVTIGRGPEAESFCGQIKDKAKSLSEADSEEISKIISDFVSILRKKCLLLTEDERHLVESQLYEVANNVPIPEKLDKIKKVVNFFLFQIQKDAEFLRRLGEMDKKLDEIHEDIKNLKQSLLDRFKLSEKKILSAIFERLDKDKLEIVRDLLDAIEKNKIPKELMYETLKATMDLILEIKSKQITIRDPDIASWDEALNPPELNVENRLKVSIPIIPLLLTYEGSYNFKSGLKLDETWKKLRKFIK